MSCCSGDRALSVFKSIIKYIKTPENFKLTMGHDKGNWKEDWTHTYDHASFHQQGIPFLYFGVEDHDDYNELTDDYENIQPDFYYEAVKIVIKVFNKLDSLQL